MQSREHWIELLAHETSRVFFDRLRDQQDRVFYCSVLTAAIKETFKVKSNFEKYGPDALLFGDFVDVNTDEADRLYRCVGDPTELAQVLEVRISFI